MFGTPPLLHSPSVLFFWIAVGLGFSLAATRLDLRLERLNTLKAE